METMSNIPSSLHNSTLKSFLYQFYANRPLRLCNNSFEHGFEPSYALLPGGLICNARRAQQNVFEIEDQQVHLNEENFQL